MEPTKAGKGVMAVTAAGAGKAGRYRSPHMAWAEVRKWRKSMQPGRANHGRKLPSMAHKMNMSLLDAYEALTGTGVYARYPKTCLVTGLEPPVSPGVAGIMEQITERNMNTTTEATQPTNGNGATPGEQPMNKHLTIRLPVNKFSRTGMTHQQAERVLQLAISHPRLTQEQLGEQVGVSSWTVNQLLRGLGPYKILVSDPLWQEAKYRLYLHGNEATRRSMEKSGYRPPAHNPYKGEGDGVVLTQHDGDSRVRELDEARLAPVTAEGTGFATPKRAMNIFGVDMFKEDEDVLAQPASNAPYEPQPLFPELEADQPALTVQSEDPEQALKRIEAETEYEMAEAVHDTFDAAPTHADLAASQAELQQAPVPQVVSPAMRAAVWQMIEAVGGPAALGLMPVQDTSTKLGKVIADLGDMHEWLYDIEDTLRVLAGWPAREDTLPKQ
jgi:hypothetical protein